MTTTAGLPGVPVLGGAVDLTRAEQLLPAAVRRSRAPWVLVCADVLGAATTAVIGGAVLPAWSPVDLLALAVIWPVLVAACGGYSSTLGVPHALRPRTLARSAALLALFAWPVSAITPQLLPGSARESARSLALLVVLLPLFSLLLRIAARPLAVPVVRRVVMVGDAVALRHMLREARRETASARSDLLPVAVCLSGGEPLDTSDVIGSWDDLTIWPGTDDLVSLVETSRADAVVIAPGGDIDHAHLRRWAAWAQDHGVELLVSSGVRDVAPYRLGRSALGGMHLLQVRPAQIRGVSHQVKGIVDRAAAGALLFFFGPLLAVIAVLVRRDSPGPALYTQIRVGRDGVPFKVYKFRSMRQDADVVRAELSEDNESDEHGVLFKMRTDPRITRLGATLRKYSLDELPQLINVVRGEMSLIGPRPALPAEVAEYPVDLSRRLVVKPGLTGLWQVSGRSDLSWEDTVRYDLQYVDNWSWALDARIAVRTVKAVLGHQGAY